MLEGGKNGLIFLLLFYMTEVSSTVSESLNSFQPIMSGFKLDAQHKKSIPRLDHQREQ